MENTAVQRDIVNLAAVNLRAVWGDKAQNLRRILDYTVAAARRGADIITFPELALTGYEDQPDTPLSEKMHHRLAESAGGPSIAAVADCCRQLGVYVVFGLPERDPATGAVYNAAAVCGPDGPLGVYRKMHPAGDESLWCQKGEQPLLFSTPWGPVGVGICYDSYSFPELLRYYAASGARLYLNPTAMPENHRRKSRSFYRDTLYAAVHQNDIFLVSANLVSEDVIDPGYRWRLPAGPGIPQPATFLGGSLVIGPGFGRRVHLYAGSPRHCEAELVLTTVDLSLANRTIYSQNPYTGTPDFRPERYQQLYGELARRQGR
ncbi:carbon-nitrogen hydrolase family protein [Neobittarella massiliensis]|uniref:carbon-nitrogen hydrolase family protein n=1 Tax=Neobittarella massiliensis (ex Bilen et al. 2018) TaxID=2041842 RepID=UPI000CF72C9B|nr:carbon-nitrogen hydrolase family protein [Neobittarella massiliensis]